MILVMVGKTLKGIVVTIPNDSGQEARSEGTSERGCP